MDSPGAVREEKVKEREWKREGSETEGECNAVDVNDCLRARVVREPTVFGREVQIEVVREIERERGSQIKGGRRVCARRACMFEKG